MPFDTQRWLGYIPHQPYIGRQGYDERQPLHGVIPLDCPYATVGISIPFLNSAVSRPVIHPV